MRLDKLLSHTGFGTRKEVKELIKKGFVCVNGEVIKKDKTQVDPTLDKVSVDGEEVVYEEFVYYMLNKPDGYVSATEDNLHPTVVELIDDYYRDDLFPVGRLDIDTEGLLLLTNDGMLAHQLLSPKKHCPKVYYAQIDGVVDQSDVEAFLDGVIIDEDYKCQEAHLKILGHDETTSEIEVEIYEGKFHQVKKMFLARNKEVTYLKRIRMKNLELDENLELGEYRRLTDEELDGLKLNYDKINLLEVYMRLRNNPKANEILENHKEVVVLNTKEHKNHWNEVFGNDNPIYIEIGMGKGDFIIENAKRYPDINFIGIEKFPSVMVGALKKLDQEESLPNLRLMKEDATFLNEVFEDQEISRIYLNFSDPWPKKKHAKRRLTSDTFLPVYKRLLKENGELILKTDNRSLFEYSLISFQQYGLQFHDVCLDLHNSVGYEDNIQTEYERKFSPFGPIYRIVTTFKGE